MYPSQRQLPPQYRRVMFFIDGGYLRRKLSDFNVSEYDWRLPGFIQELLQFFFKYPLSAELIRVYYYDANCKYEDDVDIYQKNQGYFDKLNKLNFVEVKLGQLILSPHGNRQKGVDVLMAIDMITKAYENHYDIAIVLCGDRDFMPLINTIKNDTNKRVFGVYFNNCPDDLRREFDQSYLMETGTICFSNMKDCIIS